MGGERKRRTCAPRLGNQLCPAGSGSFLRLTHRTVPCGEGGSPSPSILPHSPVSPSLLTKSVRSALGSSGQNTNCSQVLRGNFFFSQNPGINKCDFKREDKEARKQTPSILGKICQKRDFPRVEGGSWQAREGGCEQKTEGRCLWAQKREMSVLPFPVAHEGGRKSSQKGKPGGAGP